MSGRVGMCKRGLDGELIEGSDEPTLMFHSGNGAKKSDGMLVRSQPDVVKIDFSDNVKADDVQAFVDFFRSLPFPSDRTCSVSVFSEDGVIKARITLQLPRSSQCTMTLAISDDIGAVKKWLRDYMAEYANALMQCNEDCARVLAVLS